MRLVLALWVGLTLPSLAPAQVISQGSAEARTIALTFDAGADRGYAAQILTTLERNHLHATFGMTGLWAQANRDLVRRLARDGDEIINHTYNHRSFTGLSTQTAPLTAAQRAWEITQAERVIRAISGRTTKPYFRPPYGDYDAAMLTLLRRLGYRFVIMWTLDSLGWDHLPASQIVQRCIYGLRPGEILLMHVGIQSQDAVALQRVITVARKRGYHFVTVAQMMRER